MTIKLSGQGTTGIAHPMGVRTRDSDGALLDMLPRSAMNCFPHGLERYAIVLGKLTDTDSAFGVHNPSFNNNLFRELRSFCRFAACYPFWCAFTEMMLATLHVFFDKFSMRFAVRQSSFFLGVVGYTPAERSS